MINQAFKINKKNNKAEGNNAENKKRSLKFFSIITLVVMILFVGIGFYSRYVQSLVEQESSYNLLSTFNQINNTFTIFSELNWNYLKDCNDSLQSLQEDGKLDSFQVESRTSNNWDYDELYLFNCAGAYITTSTGRGTISTISDIFTGSYEKGQPMVTSYYTEDGTRKALFAIDLTAPITVDNIEYTGLAVSYLNSDLETMFVDEIYGGQSDCYIIAKDGTVLLSLEPKTEFTEHIDNMYDFFQSNISEVYTSVADITSAMANNKTGYLKCTYNGEYFYVVYQPVEIEDWSIVGVVKESVVDAGLQDIIKITVILLVALCLIGVLLIIYIVVAIAKGRLRTQKIEHSTLKSQAKLSHQLVEALAQIVERYVVIDFETGNYEYHEQVEAEAKYPVFDKYSDLLDEISRRYVITSKDSGMKIGSMLSDTYLNSVLKKEGDVVKFEYATRDNLSHKQMYVLPLEWNDSGDIKKIIFVAMDIGRRVELENQVNTDGLTGLFNERCFSEVLAQKDKLKEPYTLFYLDLDRFKPVNDTYGHDAGDKLLQGVAERILSCVRDKDQAFRIGGDEYAVIINAAISSSRRNEMVANLKKAICQPFVIDGNVISVGTSCGYAIYPFDSNESAQIRILADRRMYEEKNKNHGER